MSKIHKMYFSPESMKTENIAKGTTDPRVEFISQVLTLVTTCDMNTNLDQDYLQNLNQASTSKSQPNSRMSAKRGLGD